MRAIIGASRVNETEASENITILARVGKDEIVFPDTQQQNVFFEQWNKR